MLPQALENAIEALGHLPGVGVRTAERYAIYLLRSDPQIAQAIADQLTRLHAGVKSCPVTFALIDSSESVSELYSDPARDRTTVLVVENPLDVIALERTRSYKGTYHVLGGAISPVDGITPDQLHIRELLDRIDHDQVTEIIIATNPSVEGESTAILLSRLIHEHLDSHHRTATVTRLARGLPLGISLEYADQITLDAALQNRTQL
jgi:recombination protein RecR